MYCPRCGRELKIYEETKGYRWLYRQYSCPNCKVIWDWASKIVYGFPNQTRWKIEECHAWEAVGLPILYCHVCGYKRIFLESPAEGFCCPKCRSSDSDE